MPPSKNLSELAAKREQVVRLRAQGLTWAEIAHQTGYSDASAALKAFKAAVKEAPSLAVDELRAQERERLDILFAATAEQIRNPGPRVSAIGRLPVYPEGHPKAGQIVEDESVRARAIDNYRKISESLRRLHGADTAVAPGAVLTEDQVRMLAEVAAAKRDLYRQAPAVPLALPANYASMTPPSKPPPTSPPAAPHATPNSPRSRARSSATNPPPSNDGGQPGERRETGTKA